MATATPMSKPQNAAITANVIARGLCKDNPPSTTTAETANNTVIISKKFTCFLPFLNKQRTNKTPTLRMVPT